MARAWGGGIRRLARELRAGARAADGRSRRGGCRLTLPSSPFKGLAHFDESEYDRRLFFGRERESELVAANLMASRLTVLYGPSGVGKSSLLRAGVVQRLRSLVPATGGDAAADEVVIVDSWRDDPIAAVVAAADVRTDVPLADALAERAAGAGGELFLVLDQMEEYLLYHGRDGGPLADVVEDVLTRSDFPVHVLLGIRDDALADLDSLKRRVPGVFGNVLRLDHLTRAAARSAVHGPLRAYAELGGPEVSAEDELVEAVLDEVTAGSIQQHLSGRGLVDEERSERRVEAPFLQLVLERLWDVERERGSDVLRAATLAELGGATRIVEEHLGRALADLNDGERDLVARLLNHLVTPSGTKIAHAVEDLARYGSIEAGQLGPVLSTLEAARILRRVPGRSGGPSRYEIFHDVLAPAVLAWRDRHEADRELEHERVESRRRHRRLLVVVIVALVALAAMAALTVFAFTQRSEAREKERAAQVQEQRARASEVVAQRRATEARGRALEASSLGQLVTDPELALLLARQAARVAPGASAEQVLRRALRESRVRKLIEIGKPVVDAEIRRDGSLITVTSDGGVERRGPSASTPDVLVAGGPGVRSWLSFDRVLTVRGTSMSVLPLAGGRATTVPVPVGTRFASSGPQALLFVVAGRRGAEVIRPDGAVFLRLGHPARVQRAAFNRSGRRIVTAGADGYAMVWDDVGRLVRRFGGGEGQILDARFSPLSSFLVTAGTDGTARVWNLRTGGRVSTMPLHAGFVLRARFGVNEDSVLTASRDGTARTWKVESGGPRATFAGHEDDVTAAVLDTRDNLVTASLDGTVRRWVAQLQPDLRPAPKQTAPKRTLDPRATVRGSVVTLELDGRTVELRGHTDDVLSVEVSRDGTRVLTAGRDHTARVWNARTGELIRALKGHFGTVFDASFSPDGRWIVTAGPSAAGVWDTDTWERIYFLRGHRDGVRVATFIDPTLILTSGPGGVRRYRCDVCAPLPDLLALANERLRATGRELTAAERAKYLRG